MKTPRSIWGQSFDGTGDISGSLVGADYIMSTETTTDGYFIGLAKHGAAPYVGLLLFTYGNTPITFYTSGSERMRISQDGNIGIGTTSPSFKLDVIGASRTQYMQFLNTSLDGNAGYIGRGAATNNDIYILSVGSLRFGVNSTDNKMILDTSANLLVLGGITQYSDIRKKTKLQDVELTLKQVANAPLIEHYYNSDDKKTTHVGSIAQYWAEMNDWFCKLDSDGYYTMEIQNAALASAISIARELERYESKTDKKIRLLKRRINELEDEIEKLKNVA